MFPYPESLFGPEYHAAVYAVIVAIIAFTILPFAVTLVQWTRPPQILDFWVFIAILIIWFCAYVDPIHRSIQSTLYTCAPIAIFFTFFAGLVTLIRLACSEEANKFWTFFAFVCGVVIVLFSFMPAISMSREAAKRTQCSNNLKQIGLALHNYHDYLKSFPGANNPSRSGHPVSWRVKILPFAEETRLYEQYDQSQAWDSITNERIAHTSTYIYQCPSNWIIKDRQERYFTAYSMPVGKETFFGRFKFPSMRQATLGTSNTIMVVEACGQEIIWTEPRDVDLDQNPIGTNKPGIYRGHSAGTMSSLHGGGTNMLRMDGSVDFISEDVDPEFIREANRGAD